MSTTTLDEANKQIVIQGAKKACKTHLLTISISVVLIAVCAYVFFRTQETFIKVMAGALAAYSLYLVFYGLHGILKMRRVVRNLNSDEKRQQTWDKLEKQGEEYLEKEERKQIRRNDPKRQKIITLVVTILVLVAVAVGCFLLFRSCTSPSDSSGGYFTNAYGSPTTKCAHPGCTSYIARSGDTNCCALHSNRCKNCGKYIDEDAMYCMDCMSGHFGN